MRREASKKKRVVHCTTTLFFPPFQTQNATVGVNSVIVLFSGISHRYLRQSRIITFHIICFFECAMSLAISTLFCGFFPNEVDLAMKIAV